MNTGNSKSLDIRAWRNLYKAALFEVDKTKLPERIAQAEKALALRARGCFTQPETVSKRDKLWMTPGTPCTLCGTRRKPTISFLSGQALLRSCKAKLDHRD